MKIKSLLLLVACGTMLSASAQSHHGYYYVPKMADIDAFNNNVSTIDELNCWYTPKLIMPVLENGVMPSSNVYKDNKADMLVRPTTMNGTKNYFKELVGTTLTPSVTADNFKNGYLEVTVPDKMDYPRTEAEIPQWEKITATNGVMDFHIVLPSAPNRINDGGNSLSATGDECQLADMTTLYLGIKAPAGCKVNAYFTSAGTVSATRWSADVSGITWDPAFKSIFNTMAFDFDTPMDGTYKEFESTKIYNSTLCRDYSSTEFPKGYIAKYLDIVVTGVKPGDVVGFGGIQTLHEGWTAKSFVGGAGVNDIYADDVNAPVEVYNLNGMKVANDNLAPGVYVKRQGAKATKFVVK